MNPRPRVKLIDRMELLAFHGRTIDGLKVGGLDKKSAGWRGIEEALCLIRWHDPVRYKRLLGDIERVWVRMLPGAVGSYNASLNACQLDQRFVLAELGRPEVIASTIVHEATHARLVKRGIGYEQPIRARVERACFRRELAFAARLPDGGAVRKFAESRLAYYSGEHFTNAALSARYMAGAEEALRSLGWPEWLIKAIFRGNAILRKLRRRG